MTAYLIEASLALAVFYLFYFLALREDSFHLRNRLYLLLSSVFALGLPFLQVPVPGGKVQDLAPLNLTGLVVAVEQWPAPAFLSSEVLRVLGWLYLVGVLFLLGRLLWRLGSLAHYIRSFKKRPSQAIAWC
ncbi:MAG: hypothetical protein HC913_05975, partial [Microscillaceae bacterium]|nr:hypothetical protein [Microscillaceae bacterium]